MLHLFLLLLLSPMALNNDKKNSSNLWATACGSCLYEIDINESAHKAASLIIHDVVVCCYCPAVVCLWLCSHTSECCQIVLVPLDKSTVRRISDFMSLSKRKLLSSFIFYGAGNTRRAIHITWNTNILTRQGENK